MARSLRQWKQILPEKYHNELDRKYAKKINDNSVACAVADMESAACNESLGPEASAGFTTPVCLHIHSIRKRLADPDGVSCKAVIDGIVKAGVLQDDSAEYVKAVSYSQEQGKEDCTIITITEA
jgi:hypothetical protein